MPRKARPVPEEQPPQDDRIMAAIGHGAIILPFWGLMASVVIWATQKEKSPFVRFQALQAIAYQCLQLIASLLCAPLYMCWVIGMAFVSSISTTTVGRTGRIGPGEAGVLIFTSILPLLLLTVGFLIWLVYLGYAFWGAWSVLKGKHFRYAILGARLERYLGKGQ